MSLVRRALILVFAVGITATESLAQCAMCRATLENNLSNGQPGIGAGINVGILYLFFTPYVAVAVLAYLWYRTSKNGIRKFDQRPLEG